MSVNSTSVRDHGSFSRRGLLKGFGAALMAGVATPALAESLSQTFQVAQAEWQDNFDASSPNQPAVRSSRPTLGPESINYTSNAISLYQEIVNRGGWPMVPYVGRDLALGDSDPAISVLRQRLQISGDIDVRGGIGSNFDSVVEGALKRFQIRHGFNPDGVLTQDLVSRMNVPATTRLQQLITNAQRLQQLPDFNLPRYVTVNIPDTQVETVEGGLIHSRHAAIVGRVDRPTPLLTTRISNIIFNPYWHVPVSIIHKDIIPLMQKDPQYLTKQHIHIYDPKRKMEIAPDAVNWNTDEATNYQLKQDPGPWNSMSAVKINFPSPEGVYMHDTPSKSLFGGDQRFHSSGCVRVSNVREYVTWILQNTPGWDRNAVDAAMRQPENMDIKVADPVPLFFLYVTAWANADGVVHFRDDIYDKDGLGLAQQSAPTPG